jgi:hypothetical protein
VFDISLVDEVTVSVNLSSISAASPADKVEFQVDVDGQNNWATLVRFVGDGTVFRQDVDLDGVADANAATIATDGSPTPYRHVLKTDVNGSTLKLRLAITITSTLADIAVDDVSVWATFATNPSTSITTTIISNAGASASNKDGNVPVSEWHGGLALKPLTPTL